MKGGVLSTQLSGDTARPNLCVVGLGYIGLPTALAFSEQLPSVVGVDINQSKIEALMRSESFLPERGIEDKLNDAVGSGRLHFSSYPVPAQKYIVAVPTPLNEDKTVDMSMVESAVDSIAEQLLGDELIVIESTSPPGATVNLRMRLAQARPDLNFEMGSGRSVHVVYCPERVLPGAIFEEMQVNSRIVGGDSSVAIRRATQLYSLICCGEILTTDSKTAELTKLAENAYRDVNIAFANEISMVANTIGADGLEVIELANCHPRVSILQPGPGVGGHCIAVDPWFIVGVAPENTRMIQAARAVNDFKPSWVVDRVVDQVRSEGHQEVNVVGLTFKADVDDLRLSPSISIISRLAKENPHLNIFIYDPYVLELPEELSSLPNVKLRRQRDELYTRALTILLVAHSLDLEWLREAFSTDTLLDFTGKVKSASGRGSGE